MGGYANSIVHLLDELERISLIVRAGLLKSRSLNNKEEFSYLYVSEKEMDNILRTVTSGHKANVRTLEVPEVKDLAEKRRRLELDLLEKKSITERRGHIPRLEKLARLFHLTRFNTDTLLLCLLPEIEPEYGKIYSYLQNDFTLKQPSVGLVLDLLCSSLEEKLSMKPEFTLQFPLMKNMLVRFDESTGDESLSVMSRLIGIDERILDYLLESDEIDSRIIPFTQKTECAPTPGELVLPRETKHLLGKLITQNNKNLVCYFKGPFGSGKQTAARTLSRELGLSLLTVNVPMLPADIKEFSTAISLVFREALLQDAGVYWKDFDTLLADDKKVRMHTLVSALPESSTLNILGGSMNWDLCVTDLEKPGYKISFPVPDYETRLRLWRLHLKDESSHVSNEDLEVLSDRFTLTGGQIRDAVNSLRNISAIDENYPFTTEGIYVSCRAQSNKNLNLLTQKVESIYSWGDIVLPEEQTEQLREITGCVHYQHIVYGEWRFDKKHPGNGGINVLFSGPSGTGKTMAAGIIANELNLDIYKIDLSTVVSKYIGETEKNLSAIFREAETSNAVLFFDEADALFGKRSEIKDSHDRYANIEVSYLLQRMEEYRGIVILATNLKKNMDEAFIRRMHFMVEFPFPEEDDRRRIWNNVFPQEVPLNRDIDFKFLARQFKITGGNIVNIALSAAFLAATEGKKLGMPHIIRATKREFQKTGKLYSETDFGKYYPMLQAKSNGDG
jgi:AAA+ superfamily predicted ATPase